MKIIDSITEQLETKLNILRDEFAALLSVKNKEIDQLKLAVSTLKAQVHKLEEKANDSEAFERRDTIVVSGEGVPIVESGEICSNIVSDLVKNKLRINLNPSDISTAHRAGPKPSSQRGSDRRSIMVKLCRRELKQELLVACRNLKPNIFINESLTPTRKTIMYVLRQMKRQCPTKVSGCSSHEGRVFVWLQNEVTPDGRNRRILVNSRLKLEQLCTDIIGKPLSYFIDTWPH